MLAAGSGCAPSFYRSQADSAAAGIIDSRKFLQMWSLLGEPSDDAQWIMAAVRVEDDAKPAHGAGQNRGTLPRRVCASSLTAFRVPKGSSGSP